jgi:hypothetical protein
VRGRALDNEGPHYVWRILAIALLIELLPGTRNSPVAIHGLQATYHTRRAEFCYQQFDALPTLRQGARRELLAEDGKHRATKLLPQIPFIGPIRAALVGRFAPDTASLSHQATGQG